jgi:hypothetical protein
LPQGVGLSERFIFGEYLFEAAVQRPSQAGRVQVSSIGKALPFVEGRALARRHLGAEPVDHGAAELQSLQAPDRFRMIGERSPLDAFCVPFLGDSLSGETQARDSPLIARSEIVAPIRKSGLLSFANASLFQGA